MSNLKSQIVDIINNFLKDNKLVDARTCEGEFLGMHSSLTIGGAHEVVEELEKLLAQQVREARIDELEKLSDTYYDDGRIGWGDSTNESIEQWGDNHADLWIPTRYVHKHIDDRIAALKGDDK